MTKSAVKVLHLFRHGQTDWNQARRLQGHTDIPLNEEGRKQARELQKYFAVNDVAAFLSSDLSRAHETAVLANEILKRPLQVTASLRESFLGDLEGRTREEVLTVFGEESWQKWNDVSSTHFDFRYPRAESARETVERVLISLKDFCRQSEAQHIGVCTHGLVLRRVLHSLNPQIPGIIPVPNCSVHRLEYHTETEQFFFPWDETGRSL